ncbi:alkaline phosphatase D family protein [Thalassotalea sp. G2M2-11]|uniref:alkaline phosphatase D family protein n=1 Tax=Thalassotalea sp. G2M2-11 TaxID=2787627 RepID=UPI0019CF9C94|nr:alkaline phosphatase D family protein [Thalassotalea sp. G2M2-11]
MSSLPPIVAGPLVRHVDHHNVTLWCVTTQPYQITVSLFDQQLTPLFEQTLTTEQVKVIPVGRNAFIQCISINVKQALPDNTLIYYDLALSYQQHHYQLTEVLSDLVYSSEKLPSFKISKNIDNMLHGSCRKPHFESGDGLVQIDQLLATDGFSAEQRPSLVMMSGDQVYADDVAGPMLVAIHQVIELLGLHTENWQGAVVNNTDSLLASEFCYYQRDKLLPRTKANKAVYEKLFAASKKPIFTSVNAKNHLVTFAENIAMYLLVWSPELWQFIDFTGTNIPDDYQQQYQDELTIIKQFVQGLTSVRRALAHIPSYMIFDDHDITDDWNLTRGWEEAAYGHPFSKRIIGNSLISYWLCQGWGNQPKKFASLMEQSNDWFNEQALIEQDQLIEQLLAWQDWHYSLATTPKLVVLDTRTQRWRSESRASKPSGLMDWEALTEMQQELINEPRVILVSPAPIYGVKMIETIQKIFTFFGQPLMVDAENWMAHSGTANVILNIFRHIKTPPEFIILSGDVHYSFVYDVTHRFRRNSSKIVQVTCSGIKNEFPAGLLQWLDTLNRYLYAPYSPLNWFTKRRRMKIIVRKPDANKQDQLYNGSGIGRITLTNDADIVKAELLTCDSKTIHFD